MKNKSKRRQKQVQKNTKAKNDQSEENTRCLKAIDLVNVLNGKQDVIVDGIRYKLGDWTVSGTLAEGNCLDIHFKNGH